MDVGGFRLVCTKLAYRYADSPPAQSRLTQSARGLSRFAGRRPRPRNRAKPPVAGGCVHSSLYGATFLASVCRRRGHRRTPVPTAVASLILKGGRRGRIYNPARCTWVYLSRDVLTGRGGGGRRVRVWGGWWWVALGGGIGPDFRTAFYVRKVGCRAGFVWRVTIWN